MTNDVSVTDEIFPKQSGKSYAIVETMPGDGPMVGKGPENTVFSFPVVLFWEIILLLGVTLVIFLFSLAKQAPLGEIANPQITIDPAKAPWYFVGLQEMLEHMHPTLAGVVVPGLLVAFLVSIPYLDRSRLGAGVWFTTSRRAKRIVGWTAVYTLLVMPIYIALDNAISPRELLRDSAPVWFTQWLLPGLIIAVLVILPLLILRRWKPTTREVMLTLFTVMFVSAIVFTISGFLFRGPGFTLYWPWEMPDGYNPWDEF